MIDKETVNNPELIIDTLRAQGYRITRAREDIIKILCNMKHYTVEQLVTELKKIKDDVNVATVYNNVNFLVKEGIINEYNFNNKNSVYQLNIGLHAHLICIDCNDIYDIDVPSFMIIKDNVEKNSGFKILNAKLDMYGYCNNCKDNHIGNK
ncbi:MAG: transcriptional repressor [Bacilli bacterium]|jgi:Fur family peroxide stress response transcriptional regulator|nr:transcriptional repressor [Bacilli bacterium]